MNKRLIVLVGAVLVCIPAISWAAEFRRGEDRLVIREAINEDLYTAAGHVVIDAPVQGDVYVAGGNVQVNDTVAEDLFVGGGNTQVRGEVKGDLRIAGGEVVIQGKIGGDVIAMGGNVEITEDASIGGDLVASAGQLLIAGATHDVTAATGKLTIDAPANIEGDLTYFGEEATIDSAATITGSVDRHLPPARDNKKLGGLAATSGGILWLLSSLVMTLLFGYGLPNKSAALAKDWRAKFGSNILWGLVFMIIVPIISILLMVTVIGLPLGFIALAGYIFMMYVSKLVTALAVGAWIQSLWTKKNSFEPIWTSAVIGVLVLMLIGMVPVIGWIAVCLAFLAGLGALIRFDWNLVQNLRQRQEI